MPKKPYVWVERPTVIQAMRRAFRRYPPYQAVIKRSKEYWYQDCKNGNKRKRVHFKCEQCKSMVAQKQFRVDHIQPVIDTKVGFVDYNTYANRLFCDISNLQGLCTTCHNLKSKVELKERTKTRKEKKNGESSKVTEGPTEERSEGNSSRNSNVRAKRRSIRRYGKKY